MKYLLPFLLLLTGCGFNGNQKLTTNDSEQRIVHDGESYTYVVIRLEFIKEINQLCLDANPPSDFITEEEYTKAVAECTLEHMAIFNFNIKQVDEFSSEYCEPDADLSEFTPEEIADIEEACSYIGGF